MVTTKTQISVTLLAALFMSTTVWAQEEGPASETATAPEAAPAEPAPAPEAAPEAQVEVAVSTPVIAEEPAPEAVEEEPAGNNSSAAGPVNIDFGFSSIYNFRGWN